MTSNRWCSEKRMMALSMALASPYLNWIIRAFGLPN